jgi:hypothetical protein
MALTPTERPNQRAFREEKAELHILLGSKVFVRAPLLSRMLAYVCEQHFLGQDTSVKEYSIGTQALGRGPEFDPDGDSIVRVMASRLRKRLVEYYATEGAGHRIKIFLPESGYIPIFVTEPATNAAPPQPIALPQSDPQRRRNRRPWFVAGSILLVALGSAAYLARSYSAHRHGSADTAAPATAPSPPAASADGLTAIRIGAGLDHDRIDSTGVVWGSDRYYRGGVGRRFDERPIRRTLDPLLYLAAREGDFRYDIPLPPGTYELHLYFAETVHGIKRVGDYGEGQRQFNVYLNEKPLLTEFDIISDAAGSNTADERVFKDVSPDGDGIFHLRFSPNLGMALLSAIEVLKGTPGKMLPVRIAASETPVYDNAGWAWRRDQYFVGGNAAKWIRGVQGPKNQGLFYGYRWGHFDYAIPVADGSYTLTLYFAEAHYGAHSQTGGIIGGGVGSRLFDIFCNGEALLRRLDLFKEAGGPNVEAIKTFHHLTPNAQGKLNLSFVPVKGTAMLSAIEVVPEAE